jgi:rubrerythrin
VKGSDYVNYDREYVCPRCDHTIKEHDSYCPICRKLVKVDVNIKEVGNDSNKQENRRDTWY